MIPVLGAVEIVDSMKKLSGVLTPFSFPRSSPHDEEIISVLKQRVIEIDGVEVVSYFNRCEYPGADWKVSIILETLQVFPRNSTFLSFRISCKLARMFFGKEVPGLVQLTHPSDRLDGVRRMDVWSVYRKPNDQPIPIRESPVGQNAVESLYEGYKFMRLSNHEMVLF